MNQVILIGRLGQKPELKQVNGKSVCSVSLATSEKYKDKNGNKQELTEWHSLVFWDKAAKLIEKYCDKGSNLFVIGKIKYKNYDDKDGIKRHVTSIVVNEFKFLDGAKSEVKDSNEDAAEIGVRDGDLPF